jgi:amino acid adenylation domain-containing protein
VTTDINLNTKKMYVPATESQQEIWISCLLGGDDASRSYNLSVSLDISGPLNREYLEQSLQELINRHEALRCVFTDDASEVCIHPQQNLILYYEDLGQSSKEQQLSGLGLFVKQETNTAFDLTNGPLYNLSLFRLAEDRHVLVFTAHHIICDGWSMGLFLKELGDLYSAYVRHETPSLPHAVSWIQYALKQKKFSGSKEYHDLGQFWIRQFKEGVPVLDIPPDFTRPANRTTKSACFDIKVDHVLLSDIKTLSTSQSCSLPITFRAAFEIMLYQVSGQDELVLGLPSAGQPLTGNYSLMGHCVNLLPLKSKLQSDYSFTEYLRERKLSTLDAYDHQQFTFGSLLKILNIPRDPSRVPLVSAVFGMDAGINKASHMEGLKTKVIYNKRDYENFELFVNTTAEEEEFKFEWTYNTQLFREDSIRAMSDKFISILYTVVKDPEIKINDLLQKGSPEIQMVSAEWNNTAAEYPINTAVHEFVSRNADLLPDKIALKFNDKIITYKELNEQANRLAAYLISKGIKHGDKVALALDRSEKMLICLLAIMKSGAAYIPVDPDYPKKRIEYMLRDSAAEFLISSGRYKGNFIIADVNEIIFDEIEEQLSQYSGSDPGLNVKGNDLAYVIYTSGSTGQPKGIAIEHHSLTNFLCSMQKKPGISAADKLLAVTTISFDISGLELYLPLISGAELLLTDAETAKDGRELLDLIRKERVSILQATPSTWRMMLESNWTEKLELKALCGGEALPKDLAESLLAKCSSLWNMYGPTETTIWSALKEIRDTKDPISIGKPIDNTQIYILDQHLNPVPQGNTGEIYIGGEGLAREYLNKPELSSTGFIASPFKTGSSSRIYRTGDLGKYLPDGDIICYGRIDNQVKIRGYRIELGAIEDALNTQPLVKESAVIAREDRPGDRRLTAYIVSESAETNKAQIENWKNGIKEVLPPYMIPGDFVILDKLPLLPNGKTDRKALPKPNQISDIGKTKELPNTELEKLISGIWEDILKIQNIGASDDFFELGGHSLLAVQVMSRIEKETGIKLPLTSIFKVSILRPFAELFSNAAPNIPGTEKDNYKSDQERKEKEFIAPRTDVEQLVAEIWSEHLGIGKIGVYDDFFELGGHSLLAVRVLNQIERETGKRLPLATLFEHTTVEAMAMMLKMDARSITWDSLVPIKPHGRKMPLYIVHGAGLNVLFFNTLAKNMDPEQPVYGLQAKGLNGVDEPLEKIEDMAAYYISEIVRQNPSGPYALAGFSFGGIIAFEMAKQFKARGKEVKMLAMFDTYAYQSRRYDPTFKKLFKSARYFSKQLLYTFTLLKEDPKRTIEYKSEAIKRRLIQFYWKLKYGEKQNQEGFFGYANNIDIKNNQAWEKYVFTPYDGAIELFRAKKRTFYMDDFEYLGWKPFALKGINIHEIPGEHNYIFAPPNDKEFAEILQECLDQAAMKKKRG